MKKQYHIIIWPALLWAFLMFSTPLLITSFNLKRYAIIEYYTNPITYLILNLFVLLAMGVTALLLINKGRWEQEKWKINKEEEIRKEKAEKDNEQYQKNLSFRQQMETYSKAIEFFKYLNNEGDCMDPETQLPNEEKLKMINDFLRKHMELIKQENNQ